MSRGRRIAVYLGVLVAVALCFVGHWLRAYAPRARAGGPGSSSLPARLFASGDFPVAVWLPYPHQNLPALNHALGTDREALEALARLAGLPTPRLPGFGPLGLPPAEELVLVSDGEGERFVLAAKVYPLVAMFARLAGSLAGNPWLSGGGIDLPGARAEVAWQGRVWTVTTGPWPSLETPNTTTAQEPSLALLQLRRDYEPLAAGQYRLVREGQGGALLSGAAVPQSIDLDNRALDSHGAFLLLMEAEEQRALAGLRSTPGTTDPPRTAALTGAGGERFTLPAESLLELAGSLPTMEHSGLGLVATDERGLSQAAALAPQLQDLLIGGDSALRYGLWLDLEGGAGEVSRIAELLQEMPLIRRSTARQWRDAATVLAPLGQRRARLTLAVSAAPWAFALRYKPGETEPPGADGGAVGGPGGN